MADDVSYPLGSAPSGDFGPGRGYAGSTNTGAQGGAGLLKPRRAIGTIIPNVVIEEQHTDEVHITEHPVEQGAQIADHVFRMPAELSLQCAWSPSGVTSGDSITQVDDGTGRGTSNMEDVYQGLLDLMTKAVPMDVYTGKRKYTDMLLRSIRVNTDRRTENALVCTLGFRQVILVATQVLAVSSDVTDLKAPESNAASTETGNVQAVPKDMKDSSPEFAAWEDSQIGKPLISTPPPQ